MQEMKGKIYSELVDKARPVKENRRDATQKTKPQSFIRSTKTDLDDLVAKYIISALVCYPQLIEEYEERLLDFVVKDAGLQHLYEAILDIARDCPDLKEEAVLAAKLEEKNLGGILRQMIDVRILKKQCSDIIKMRKDLDNRIIEVQLRQLEADIRESKRVLESGNFTDEEYRRFEALKKERDALLQENDGL